VVEGSKHLPRTGRKHGESLEALGHGVYSSIAKRNLQKQCENYPKINGQTNGGSRTVAPLNTPLIWKEKIKDREGKERKREREKDSGKAGRIEFRHFVLYCV